MCVDVCVWMCVCVCAYVYVCGCVKTYAHVHQLLWCAAVLVLTCTPTTEVTERTLAETREQADKSLREKNDMIAQLTQRIQSMESAYEGVLNVSTQYALIMHMGSRVIASSFHC